MKTLRILVAAIAAISAAACSDMGPTAPATSDASARQSASNTGMNTAGTVANPCGPANGNSLPVTASRGPAFGSGVGITSTCTTRP